MVMCVCCRVIFGHLLEVRGDKYATVIDTAPSQTLVLLHIYDEVSRRWGGGNLAYK